MYKQSSKDILDKFLNITVSNGEDIFKIFSELPGAVIGYGKKPLERYVYIPGKRKNRVVLVAHTDTVWDNEYGASVQSEVCFENGVYFSKNTNCGIGADDRAGCAMLWALKESGHSLLLLDGEEHGKIGAKYLHKANKKVFRQLNRHKFMIALDWQGTNGCLYNQVDNTPAFKNYIAAYLGFQDDKQKGGSDLQILCQRICGVNVGVGYHNYHRHTETLNLEEWENTYQKLSGFLQQEHPVFKIPLIKRLRAMYIRFKVWVRNILHKLNIV